ncbi:MAG: FAD-dependent oxidoreductase, partial [Bacilli bacterium]|nr:FAD-dependent oxidoreductase [Bacilli bacterium]
MRNYDVLIVGGSLGAVFAALGVALSNQTCLIINEYEWIGGQLTSQAVPPDEHDYIEAFGSTKSYREFRNLVRKHYQELDNFTDEAKQIKQINPGGGWVSKLSHEPKVSLKVLYQMLDPYLKEGLIEIINEAQVKEVFKEGNKITQVKVESKNDVFLASGKMYLDATDTGLFLPMSKTEFTVGSENTDEFLSNGIDDPEDVQAFTWVAAIEYDEGGNHKLKKPKMYDFFRNYKVPYDDNGILSWYFQNPRGGGKKLFAMFEGQIDPITKQEVPALFTYRQIIKKEYYKSGVNDVTLVNWGQNDYHFGSVFEEARREEHLEMSRELTKSLLYWLNTEAPRHDGGFGYPEINIRPDIVGTDDGLAQAPYI